MGAPSLSVIVPVRNGGPAFELCLAALGRSEHQDFELLVVDDGSSDGSVDAAQRHGATVLTTAGSRGPAAARNLGAASAAADILLFVDADCEVHKDTLTRVVEALAEKRLTAVFGSYDDDPSVKSTVSRFRNLLHHYVHHTAAPKIETFWAGCGAIRKPAFLELGGFNEKLYERPCIEDIELGYRLTDSGANIEVRSEILVRHHKHWTFLTMLVSDLRDRGIPWTRLLLARESRSRDLNLSARGRLGVALAATFFASLALAVIWPPALVASGLITAALLVAFRDFYRLLFATGGFALAALSVPLHLVHLASSAVAFVVGALRHLLDSARRTTG